MSTLMGTSCTCGGVFFRISEVNTKNGKETKSVYCECSDCEKKVKE